MADEYVDGLSDVVIVGATARIQFFVLRPEPVVQGQRKETREIVKVESPLVLVIPVEGLATAVTTLETVRTSLLQSGKLVARESAQAKGEQQDSDVARASPNFSPKSRN